MARPDPLQFRLASWTFLLCLLAAGCAPRTASTATSTTAATDTPSASATTAASAATATATPAATQASQGEIPVSGSDVLYQDDFTNSASGWPEAKFDNYFVGYHEPTYYHVEIDSPNYHATVFVPGKKAFDDTTIQVTARIVPDKTAAKGDFAYGIAFRRSGDNYYAFVVSPRSQKWQLLKSSPNALVTLAQGADTSLHAADVDDLLRVDAQGSTFSLHINGRLVAQVSDKDYASGEVGFYVQTYDSQQVHIHFDDLTISAFSSPSLCKVQETKNGIYMRGGPGYGASYLASLTPDEPLEPLGHSLDGNWLYVQVERSGVLGWVPSAVQLVSCNLDVSTLPIIVP